MKIITNILECLWKNKDKLGKSRLIIEKEGTEIK